MTRSSHFIQLNFLANHFLKDASIDVMKKTIDITTIVVQQKIDIIVPLLDTSTTIWMFGISLYSNGKCSQLHSKTHIEFYVFAWPGHFIQRWILTVQPKHVEFPLRRLQSCGHSGLYQAILYKVSRKASSELYMGDDYIHRTTQINYFTLRYARLHYTIPHYRTHNTTQRNATLHYTTLYAALHYTTLHYTTLH